MDWYEHPRFRGVRDRVLTHLKRDAYRFRRLPTVIFLCGASGSRPRDALAQYVRMQDGFLVFYAEGVWAVLARHAPTANALEMEDRLAGLADVVIIIAESPGTFAELGAFALSQALREKLLPILEVAYRGSGSFLELGPVRWIDESSRFRPSIWVKLDSILLAGGEVDERLKKIPKARRSEVSDLHARGKHLVFFLADLVAVFGPCPLSHVEKLAAAVLEKDTEDRISLLLGLAAEMKLLKSLELGGVTYYYRPLSNDRLSSYHRTRKFADVASLRTEVVGALLGIPEVEQVLKALEDAEHAT